jgi:hypothetical protein
MTCKEERYQHANKEKVIHHFRQLLNEVLPEPKERVATEKPKAENEARIMDKKLTSKTKQLRQKIKEE